MKRVSLIPIAETQQQAGEIEEESDLGGTDPPSTCAIYIKTKQQRKIIKKLVERTTRPFKLIYSDLCSPISPPPLAGARYFALYIDDFSCCTWVYLLLTKTTDEVTSKFQEFKDYIEKQWLNCPITRFRCDNGKGRYSNSFHGILSVSGISYEPSPPCTQHQNGVSK